MVWLSRHGLLAVVGVLAASPCLASEKRHSTSSAFIWSPQPYLAHSPDQQTSRVFYEAVPSSILAQHFVGGLFGDSPVAERAATHLNVSYIQSQPPDLTVVFLGSKLSTHQLVHASGAGALRPLQTLLQEAASSLSLPHVVPQEGRAVAAEISAAISELGGERVHRIGSCEESPSGPRPSTDQLQQVLAGLTVDVPQAILVCLDGADLEAEVGLLPAMTAAVLARRQRPVFVFAAEPAQGTDPSSNDSRRRLQQAYSAPVNTKEEVLCGPKCRTQVKLLEAFILAVTVICALGSGTLMLHALNAPTRFETPKDSSAAS